MIAGVLSGVPFAEFVIAPFVGFYAATAATHAVGRAWGELQPVGLRDRDRNAAESPFTEERRAL